VIAFEGLQNGVGLKAGVDDDGIGTTDTPGNVRILLKGP
jgi:hypothetical protein